MASLAKLIRVVRSFTEQLFGFGPQQANDLKESACSICRFREAVGATTPQAMLETREASGVDNYTTVKGAADEMFIIEDHKVLGAEHSVVYPLHARRGLYVRDSEVGRA